jgi:hypothetical protein
MKKILREALAWMVAVILAVSLPGVTAFAADDSEIAHNAGVKAYASGCESTTYVPGAIIDNNAGNSSNSGSPPRWAGAQSSGTTFYPQWAALDLGAYYDISAFEVAFFNSGTNRVYFYEVRTLDSRTFDLENFPTYIGVNANMSESVQASNAVSSKFKKIYERTASDGITYKTGKKTVSGEGTQGVRYIMFNITGVSNNINTLSPSIFEVYVYGAKSAAQKYLVSGVVDKGSLPLSSTAGLTVGLYAPEDTAFANPLYTALTDERGKYAIEVAEGQFVARVRFNDNEAVAQADARAGDVTANLTLSVGLGATFAVNGVNTDTIRIGETGRLWLSSTGSYKTAGDITYSFDSNKLQINQNTGAVTLKPGYVPNAREVVPVTVTTQYYNDSDVLFYDSFEGTDKTNFINPNMTAYAFKDDMPRTGFQSVTLGSQTVNGTVSTHALGSSLTDVVYTGWYYDGMNDLSSAVETKFGFAINGNSGHFLGVFHHFNSNNDAGHYAYRINAGSGNFSSTNSSSGGLDVIPRTLGWHKFQYVISSATGVKALIDGKTAFNNTAVKAITAVDLATNWAEQVNDGMNAIRAAHRIDDVSVVKIGAVPQSVNTVFNVALEPLNYAIAPSEYEFDKGGASADLVVGVSPRNDVTSVWLSGTELQKGVDYTINGSDVVFAKTFLNALNDGTNALTLYFGEGKALGRNLTVTVLTAPVIESFAISPKTAGVEQGGSQSFTPQITVSSGKPNPSVAWEVSGATVPGTRIQDNGQLFIARTEPVGAVLTVKASVTGDNGTKSDTASVTVTEGSFTDIHRVVTDLNAGWKFGGRGLAASESGPNTVSYYDAAWETVNVPHSWNAVDGSDGGNNYVRNAHWYRRDVAWDPAYEGKTLTLEIGAASLKASVYINGEFIGEHKGGYSAFRFDITGKLNKTGTNKLAVVVDNRHDPTIAPQAGDFTFAGGMYRHVNIIAAETVHVDLFDNASPGVYITPVRSAGWNKDTNDKWEVNIRSKIANDSNNARAVTVTAILRHPGSFDAIAEIPNPRFNPNDMFIPGAPVVKQISKTITVPALGSVDFNETITDIMNPRLWDGLESPYCYKLDFEVSDGAVLDSVSQYIGFRWFDVVRNPDDYSAPDSGFFLNGRLYPLRGVGIHQDWARDGGYGITDDKRDIDVGFLYEMGANWARVTHYPHPDYTYRLLDRYGIVCSAEVPWVNLFSSDSTGNSDEGFHSTTMGQMRDMVKQLYNHPSILIWGLENELGNGRMPVEKVDALMKEMNDFAHAFDPVRKTTQATDSEKNYQWLHSDLLAWNRYPGWYTPYSEMMGTFIDEQQSHDLASPKRPIGFSEYGCGGNPNQHDSQWLYAHDGLTVTAGWNPWHPEEYMNHRHELALHDINERPWLWCTTIWNLFEFASDQRNEGELPGINDKGLITLDRKIKKDPFFLYKVNWNPEPETYITSRRFVYRPEEVTPVTVYSNCDSVELLVNGVSRGVIQKSDASDCIFKWASIQLTTKSAGNDVVAIGRNAGVIAKQDAVIWHYGDGATTQIASDVLGVDNIVKEVMLAEQVSAQGIDTLIWPLEPGMRHAYQIMDGDAIVTEGIVKRGMLLKVTNIDDGSVTVYTFVQSYISAYKAITASSNNETASNAVDLNAGTVWEAADTGAQQLDIDLGHRYLVNRLAIDWVNVDAASQYSILVSEDGVNYTTAVDRSRNTFVKGTAADRYEGYARYVRLSIQSGAESGAVARIAEIRVYGWRLDSDVFTVNEAQRTILAPGEAVRPDLYSGGKLLLSALRKYLIIDGNCTEVSDTVASTLSDGDKYTVKDRNGRASAFLLYSGSLPAGPFELATSKPPFAEGHQVDNPIYAVNDGDLASRWANPDPAFPRWVMVDLGAVCDISQVTLHFFRPGTRSYRYEILASATGMATADFKQITNQISNTNQSGVYSFSYTGTQARYVKVNVTGASETANASLFEIFVKGIAPCAVTAVNVSPQNAAVEPGQTLVMSATVSPAEVSNKNVVWSIVDGASFATMSPAGVLTALAEGVVKVRATSVSAPYVTGDAVVAIKSDQGITIADTAEGITARAVVNDISQAGKECSFIVAMYDGTGRLIKISQTTASVDAQGKLVQSVTVAADAQAKLVKAFLWDSGNFKPVLPEKHISI